MSHGLLCSNSICLLAVLNFIALRKCFSILSYPFYSGGRVVLPVKAPA